MGVLKKTVLTLSPLLTLLGLFLAPAQAHAYGKKRMIAVRIHCENPRDIAGDGYIVQAFDLGIGPDTKGPMFQVTGKIRLSSAFEREITTYASGEFTAQSIKLDIADVGQLEVRRFPNGTYSGTAAFFSKPATTDLLCTVK